MRLGSLCSGVGLLDLAVESLFGAETVWQAENDKDASKVLARHWPGVPNLGDLKGLRRHDYWRATMAAPRCDERAQAMYDRYCQGLSLAEVGREFDCTRQSVFKMFWRRNYDLRPRPPARPTIQWGGRKFSLRNNGYYGATEGDRELLHRVIWMAAHGAIPEGWDIHHLDHDKTHNDLNNFECLPKSEHAHRYNMGCNGSQHRCGIEGVVPRNSPMVDILTAGYP